MRSFAALRTTDHERAGDPAAYALDRHDRAVLRRVVVGSARRGLSKDLDQPAARVARIDDIVDAEALGGAQGADSGARLIDHLLPTLLRIGCLFVVLAEGDIDRALDRHGADLSGRPGEAG